MINEPRCTTDVSGKTLQVSIPFHLPLGIVQIVSYSANIFMYFFAGSQDWIDEMTGFIKSIDDKHLLTVGLEGFYGPNSPKGLTVNPEQWASQLGTDFVQNSNSSNIDFASVHIYPDHW